MQSTVLLLPKLHLERMCLMLNTVKGTHPASKNLRRKARYFVVSLDKAFDEVRHASRPLLVLVVLLSREMRLFRSIGREV